MVKLDILKDEDQMILFEHLDDPKITQYYMLPIFSNDEEKLNFAKRLIRSSKEGKALLFGIYDDETLVGFTNQVSIENGEFEVGYVIFTPYHRKGYGLKALNLFIEKIKDLGYSTVIAGAFKGNEASMGLLKKAGFKEIERFEEIEYRGVVHECVYFQFVIQ